MLRNGVLLNRSTAPNPRRWIALPIVLTGVLLVIMDVFILYVATPSIQADLGATYAQSQLIVAAYHLTYAVFLITGGRLGDVFGRRRMFLLGMIGFTVTSTLCGIAPSPEALIAGRIAQGVTAAMLFPQVLSTIRVLFPAAEHKIAFGCYGGVLGLASVAGQVASGFILKWNLYDLAWRPIFLINIPVGLVAVVAAWRLLPESRSTEAPRLDLAGVGLATTGLAFLLYALTEGHHAGWPPWAWGCLATSALPIAAFWALQRRKAATGRSPLIHPELFRDRAFVVGILIAFIFYMGTPSFFMVFTYYLQQGLKLDALTTGTTFVPCSLGVALAAFLSPLLVAAVGRFVLAIGAALQVAGILAMITPTVGTEALLSRSLWLAMLVLGLGQGLTLSPLANAVLASSRSAYAGAAAGVLATFQQLGGSVGVAIVGAALASFLGAHQTWGEALGHALVFHLIFFSAILALTFVLPRPTLASISKGVAVGQRISGAAPLCRTK